MATRVGMRSGELSKLRETWIAAQPGPQRAAAAVAQARVELTHIESEPLDDPLRYVENVIRARGELNGAETALEAANKASGRAFDEQVAAGAE